MPSHRHPCALCDVTTNDALAGNRLLSHAEIQRLPAEHPPLFSWRCELHQRSTMRAASAVRATADGDLLFTLVCGHEVCWMCRGPEAYTPALLERRVVRRQIRLDQPQRCYGCGDVERASAGQP